MDSERNISTTRSELDYREKHFHDIRVVKDSQISCACCGKKINAKQGKLHTHPVVGTLQCEECHSSFDDIEFTSDDDGNDKYCRLCGHNKPLVICKKQSCHLGFCKKCIERNAGHNTIASIKSKGWKCFVCHPEPLWKQRAICAAVMDAYSKRCNRKKSSRGNSKDIDENVLPHIRQQYAHTKRLQKNLQAICDDDDDEDNRNNMRMRPIALPISRKVVDKSKHSNKKNMTEDQNINEDTRSNKLKCTDLTVDSSESSDSESTTSDDLSDIDFSNSVKDKKKTANDKNVKNSHKNVGDTSKPNSTMRSNKSLARDKKSQHKVLRSNNIEESDIDSESSVQIVTRSHVKGRTKRQKQSDTDSESEEEGDGQSKSVNKTKKIQNRSNKSSVNKPQHKGLAKLQSENESSSGKEFQQLKFRRSKLKPLRTLSEIDKDYTQYEESDPSSKRKRRMIGEKEGKLLKSYFNKKLGEIQDITVLNLSRWRQKNNEQKISSQEDAHEMVRKTEKVVSKMRKMLDKAWHDMSIFYQIRCKKQDQHIDEVSSDVSTDIELDEKRHNVKITPCKPQDTSGKENSIVSDCDSGEIFSDDENRKSNQSKAKSTSEQAASDSDNKSISSFHNSTKRTESTPIKERDLNSDENESKVCSETSASRKSVRDDSEDNSDVDMESPVFTTNISREEKNKPTVEPEIKTDGKNTDDHEAETPPLKNIDIAEKCSDSTKDLLNNSDDIFESSGEAEDLPSPLHEQNPKKPKCDSIEVTASMEQSGVTEQSADASVDDVLEEKTGKENQNSDVTPDNIDKEQTSEQETVGDSNAFVNDKIDNTVDTSTDVQNNDKKLPNPDDTRSDSDINSVSTVCYQDIVKDVSETEKIDEENDSGNSELPETSENSELAAERKAKQALLLSDTDSSLELETNCGEKKAKRNLLLSSSESTTSDNDITLDATSSVETDQNSVKTSLKRNRDVESDTSSSIKTKRKRFKLDKNRYYIEDKKLRMVCQVRVARLPKKILRRHKHALERSRRNVESKEIESLVDLDKLKKKQKKCANDDSDDNNPSSRSLRKRKPNPNEKEDSLMDHLHRIENGEELDITDKNSEKDSDQQGKSKNSTLLGNDDLISLMNQEEENDAKQLLLRVSDSSSEDATEQNDIDGKDTDPKEKKKSEKNRKESKSRKKLSEETQNSSEEEKGQNWRRDRLLTMKFSDSDTEKESEKWTKSQESRQSKESENNLQSPRKTRSKKKKGPRRILDSDSEGNNTDSDSNSQSSIILSENKESTSDSEEVKKKKKKQRKRPKSSDTDSSLEGKKSKPKRKRIKQPVADSDSDSENMQNSQESPCKSGRKNIRKVLKDKQVADDTKQAAKEEEDRLKRIAERQKLYNEIYEMKLASEEKVEKVVLDFDPNTKKELVTVHEDLVKRLKPHQAKGIKFMWDACFESLERVKKDSKGSGCILAHCMGLGKTLQVIALSHTLLTHEETGIKTIMVICPLSTVLNWVNEFHTWLKDVNDDDTIEVYELTKSKKNYERMYQLEQWQRTGGVLIIGYEMFRNLSNASKKMRKTMRESILRSMVDPGADLVVCDEGHLLKNEDSALSKCMKQVKTLRRIVLTGTPLQNNLFEYHCMVQFVKPNLLGTKKEFSNRFVQPITNGQFDDSTPSDVKLMKKRAHVLHKMLEGSVQRFDYNVLTPFLPPKQEYVIFVRLTEVQIKIYQYYLDNFARKSRSVGGSLFADFQELQRIWTHPIVLRLNAEKVERANDRKHLSSESEGSLKDFIDDGDSDSSSSDSDIQSIDSAGERIKRSTRNNPVAEEPVVAVKEEEPKTEWWTQFVEPEHFQDMRISGKLMLLFEILKESEQIGDKVLVFSQSLYSLTLIEEFLSRIDEESQNGESSEFLERHVGNWALGVDYFRLDGQTSAEHRNIWCKEFNKPSNTRARLFLISTRAGGLGINLTAANRVVIFDASWNPSHDVQSIFRIYRFGQKKPCYVYRLLAYGTMEEKIYNRQVTKLSLSCRVVDEQQIERHYSTESLSELYSFQVHSDKEKGAFLLPKDTVLANILLKYKNLVENYHEHDSLLENRAEEELNEEDRKQAWLEYEEEKKGRPTFVPTMPNGFVMQPNMLLNADESMRKEFEILQQLIRKDYPNLAPEMQNRITQQTLSGMYSYMERQVGCSPQQVHLGGNLMNPRNIMPQNIHGGLINNPQNVLSLFQQNQLAIMQAQRQLQQRPNYDARILNANQPVQSSVINVDDAEMATTTRNVQLPAQSSGNSKGQEE